MMTITPIVATLFSPQDMLIIFLIVLLLFGAKKLPDLARGMGQAVREFSKAKDEIEREMTKPAVEASVQPPKEQQEHKPAEVAQTAEPAPVTPAATPTTKTDLPA
jgi:sec-independent protein translocase protein TatA